MSYNNNDYKEGNSDWEIIYENDEKKELEYNMNDIINDVIDNSIKKSDKKDELEIDYIDFYINDINFKILETGIKFNFNKLIQIFENFIINNMDEDYYNFLSI